MEHKPFNFYLISLIYSPFNEILLTWMISCYVNQQASDSSYGSFEQICVLPTALITDKRAYLQLIRIGLRVEFQWSKLNWLAFKYLQYHIQIYFLLNWLPSPLKLYLLLLKLKNIKLLEANIVNMFDNEQRIFTYWLSDMDELLWTVL